MGNVGTHLARRLAERGRTVQQLVGRDVSYLQQLAAELETDFTVDLAGIDTAADLYLLAVPDDAIAPVANQLAAVLPARAFVVHTSGATPTAAVAESFSRAGVFYPLQSFNRAQPVDWERVPLLYHATESEDRAACAELAAALSPITSPADDDQRAALHLAAVFANNFTNHLLDIAYRITRDAELDFSLLLPLIHHTVERLDNGRLPPADRQTGPAARGDRVTIERHLRVLAGHPEWRKLYRALTRLIAERKG